MLRLNVHFQSNLLLVALTLVIIYSAFFL